MHYIFLSALIKTIKPPINSSLCGEQIAQKSGQIFLKYEMKIIKKGQTNSVYSVYTNRAFDHIQLLVQSLES